jgi:GMP synthase PP-ATPase subunit
MESRFQKVIPQLTWLHHNHGGFAGDAHLIIVLYLRVIYKDSDQNLFQKLNLTC